MVTSVFLIPRQVIDYTSAKLIIIIIFGWCLIVGSETSHIVRNCERAVVTAYQELRQVGTTDVSAFHACTTLYRIHHPEASLNEARRLVSEWIDHHVVHHRPGPTTGCECA
ncbi:hypothetical protein GHA01_18550 [Novacetimonas hansenii]|uniref:Uncharacterized protein n=1 Tax=Novacetimonas hansenii TaxID=436 RepID=A0ABQ0SFA7_NOVHA|nr:hypothetical protein Gaha_0052_019 [Novacetimonas hansenii JCM 7643]GBQ59569.1 hypothetical protein AA0243_2081 [Novacetimonas hansenii NRIC 0243]GEC64006.1 hypothetical protein GHA01_18550 [Novacetimonas hansenii]